MKHWHQELLDDPKVKKLIEYEIGDLIYDNSRELFPGKNEGKRILLARGFKERQGLKNDFVKYIRKDLRIHIKLAGVKRPKYYYHLDKH